MSVARDGEYFVIVGNSYSADGDLYGTADTINTYGYDTQWKDKLVSYNGESITYDEIGNPQVYIGGYNFTWQNGRRLSGYTKGTDTVSYTYDDSGIRQSKTVNGTVTSYVTDGSAILAQTTGTDTLYFFYDNEGNVYGFKYNDDMYYYIRNGQGDIIGIVDSTGTQIVSYIYDSWGTPVRILGTNAEGNFIDVSDNASHIANRNPFRYRGYYYDNESGFYYLQSRYYDSQTGRFINADGILGANGDIIAYNLYAYCSNNPVCFSDPSGATLQDAFNFSISAYGKELRSRINSGGGFSNYYKQEYGRLYQYYYNLSAPASSANVITEITVPIRDVTDEVDAKLLPLCEKLENIRREADNSSLPKSNLADEAFIYGSFYLLVNHEAPWDLKYYKSWESTIGTPFPGQHRLICYRGIVMTTEGLGNYTYGYMGAAYGIPYPVLLAGSYYAAGFPTKTNDLRNEFGDWGFITYGYFSY